MWIYKAHNVNTKAESKATVQLLSYNDQVRNLSQNF